MTMFHTTDVATPVGDARVAVRLEADRETIVGCAYVDCWETLAGRLHARFPDAEWTVGPTHAAAAIERYLAGDLDAIDGLDVDPGGTAFQQRVWAALRTIPVGQTRSYLEIATLAGDARSTRAVGSANGANPIWLVVPCHRVVRADGDLGGYAGGLERKAWLLAHEGARLA